MDGDDGDQGHSINDDYRMAGLRGDDDSDLEADREELFGVVPPIPTDVDAEDVDTGPGDNPVAACKLVLFLLIETSQCLLMVFILCHAL
jgi:hypothetical protein